MTDAVTVAGDLISLPEFGETAAGKTARFGISVTTRRRDGDDWIDDPALIYEVVVSDEEGLGVVSTIGRGDRILVSGLVRQDRTPPVIEATGISISLRFHGAS